ncbi:hypothetical protein UYSO10_2022 [Kosakonia radicincitans]|nr:hypothetical protein UYSO10_2022 [Kosakonia radicincitans]
MYHFSGPAQAGLFYFPFHLAVTNEVENKNWQTRHRFCQ